MSRPSVSASSCPIHSFRAIKPLALAVALAFIQFTPAVQAANCTLTTNGTWQTPANWSCGVRPVSGDSATINLAGLVTINLGDAITTLSNAGTINIDAFGLNLVSGGSTINTGTINVGGPSTANIGIGGGHNINNTGGVINIANGSVVNQFGSTITGGTIATTGTGALVVFGNNVLSGVTLNGTLDAAANTVTEHIQNGLTLNGTVKIDNSSLVNLEGTQTIGGTGSFVFGAAGNNRLGVDGGSITTTLGANITVRGNTGTVGVGQLINGSGNTLINLGKISSDSGGTINIAGAALTNQGIVEATGAGSVLRLDSAVANTGGILRSTAGGVVLQNGVSVTGGTIANSGGGVYRATSSGSNFLNGVTLTSGSVIDLASATSTERVTGGMTLNGTVNVNNSSLINFEGDQTLSGSGSIIFGAAGNNRVGVDGGSKTLTLASTVTIRGENGSVGLGQLVNGSGNALVNNGTISADVAGGTITLLGLGAGITNNGTISAQNGGTIALQSNLTGGVGGQLVAGAGSLISQQGITISGTVNTSGGGSLRPTGSGSNFLSGVTLNGNLDMATATATERVINNLALNGAINVDNSSLINFEGTQTLSGNGTIIFGATGNNRVGVDGGSKTLTIANTVTIRGENGTIGPGQLVNGSGNAVINNGTISANVSGGTITLAGLGGGITNNGTISALNGGTIALQTNLIGSVGGQLVAGAGSLISQQGVTISGVVNTSGGGSLRPTGSGSNFLSGVTLNGNLDMATATATERVINNLALNGAINVDNSSLINFEGDQTLSGSGSIIFGATGNNRLGVDGGSKTLTIANSVTIRGQNGSLGLGQLVNGSGNTIINQGLISSDSGGTVNVAQSTLVNQSFAEAVGAGSVLRLDSDVTNTGGTLRSTTGGVVLQNGVTVTGGNITNSNGGTYRLSGSGSNVLSGVTLTSGSTIDMATATATGRVVNGMTVNGTVNLDNSSLLNMEGTQNLAGTGSIVFGATGNNRVGVDGGGKTLTIAAGATISGVNGSIGLGQLINGSGNGVINNGTINTNGGGTITIQGLDSGITNNGLLRAQNGTLNVSTALSGTGALQVDANGVMNLANGTKAQGILAMGTTGAALNLGTGNLTINSDYTNAAAGTGNAFNRRAGVTGTGQIVAGGNAAQAITGTGVTGGTTANATLTLGNVRVGSTTFNYQVADNGTTGPALRGAIQTSVNGGNLTDARLSGAGVTASNYNTGPVGSNTGDLAVTFTAASAGLLAPLSAQAVNLRSNFENIADQKLNIVLAGGAAAYNAAAGNAVSPVVVANQRVNGTNTVAVTVANTAAAGPFSEDLNVSLGALSGVTGSGSITGRLAGSNNTGSGAITVGVNATTAGAKTGTVTLNYQTAGAVGGVSNGLGVASVGSQVVTVTGNVYNIASHANNVPNVTLANQRVGGTLLQDLTVTNTAAPGAFSEAMNVSFGANSGQVINNAGTVTNLIAGGSSTGVVKVGVNTSTSGAKTGQARLNFETDGTGPNGNSGLAVASIGLNSFTVGGNVYQVAAGQLNSAPLNFGTVQVGQNVSQVLSITNSASGAAGFVEDLNASFGAFTGTGNVSGSGAVNGLLAGATANSGMTVTVNTSAAGNVAGNIAVNFFSAGAVNGSSNGLGSLAVGSASYGVNGVIQAQANVINTASPIINNSPINLGNVRVGAISPTGLVSVTNQATVAPQAALNASITGNGGITGSGSFSLLNPGGTNSSSLQVGMTTGTAGNKNGTATIAFVSDASNVGNCAPNCQLNLASQNVTVNGAVYREAALATTSITPSITLAARVGGSASANISITNNSVDGFTEGLNVTRGTTAAGFTSSGGPISNLAANASSSALNVALNTATAGSFSGNQVLSLESNGSLTNNSNDVLGNVNVALSGKVYTVASAQVTPTTLDFGIVHVGDVVAAQTVAVKNTASVTSLNDVLTGSFGGASSAFTASGSLGGGVAAQATDSTSLKASLNTSTAGNFNSTGFVNLKSHDADLADVDLGTTNIALQATVNNYAKPVFKFDTGVGSLSGSGTSYTLDFGTVVKNSATRTADLDVTNLTSGPSDLLKGSFSTGAPLAQFLLSGFNAFSGLQAGQSTNLFGALDIKFFTSNLGLFTQQITLASCGYNSSGYNLSTCTNPFGNITLTVLGNVVDQSNNVPEPGSFALGIAGLLALAALRRRSTAAKLRH